MYPTLVISAARVHQPSYHIKIKESLPKLIGCIYMDRFLGGAKCSPLVTYLGYFYTKQYDQFMLTDKQYH